MRRFVAGLLFSALVCIAAGPAAADGIGPHYTETWLSLGNDGWEIDGFHWGSPEYELFDIEPSVISEMVFEGNEFVGWNVDVTVPNIVDPLPVKQLKVLFEGFNADSSAMPSVLGILATDTLFGGGPTSTISCPEDCVLLGDDGYFKNGSNSPAGPDDSFVKWEWWEFYPNPDWELVTVFIPVEFEPTSFHIKTESMDRVPEPAAMAMLGSGLLGLIVAGRRRS